MTNNEEVILSCLTHLQNGGSIGQLADITRRPNDGVRGTLRNLHRKGYVEKVERGVWKLSQEGLKVLEHQRQQSS
jgi:DNA-binding IclR family transcriptional regulator